MQWLEFAKLDTKAIHYNLGFNIYIYIYYNYQLQSISNSLIYVIYMNITLLLCTSIGPLHRGVWMT